MDTPIIRLQELDARHGELLDRLAELDDKIDNVLNEWTRATETFVEEQQKRSVTFEREMAMVADREIA